MLPFAILVCGIALVAALTGFTVWHHASLLGVSQAEPSSLVPRENQLGLLTVACYHFTAYASAGIGGILLCVWVWMERGKRATRRAAPTQDCNPASGTY